MRYDEGNARVRSDKIGLYIVADRRRFRPPATGTLVQKSDGVDCRRWSGKRQNSISVRKYGPWYEVDATRQAWTARGTKTETYKLRKHDTICDETWTCNDPRPQIKERLKDGQVNLQVPNGKGTTPVIVGSNGVNYQNYRREPSSYQTATYGKNVLVYGKMLMSWDEWDEFVTMVDDARVRVYVQGTVEALESEKNLHDYLVKKGLKDDDETDVSSDE